MDRKQGDAAQSASAESAEGEALVGRLIAAAGSGPTASAVARQRIYDEVHARWRESVRENATTAQRTRGRRFALFSMAASIAVAAFALVALQLGRPELAVGAALAQVDRVDGNVTRVRDDEAQSLAATATAGAIEAGDVLRTGPDGRLALRLDGGALLRMNVGSEIVVAAADVVELVAGTLYIDSGAAGPGAPLEIRTELGAVSHLGTQYEAQVAGSGLRLRVREGSVRLARPAGAFVGSAGEELRVGPGGTTERGTIAADDPAWSWAVELATLPEASEYRLGDTLRWLAREQGLSFDFPSEAATLRWDGVTVGGGGLAGLSPAEILGVLEQTTDIRLAVEDGRLLILE